MREFAARGAAAGRSGSKSPVHASNRDDGSGTSRLTSSVEGGRDGRPDEGLDVDDDGENGDEGEEEDGVDDDIINKIWGAIVNSAE